MAANGAAAAASAHPADATRSRMDQLEAAAAAWQAEGRQLKAVNEALMERLTQLFQAANEANVTEAEEELTRMHEALRSATEAAARREAAAAAELEQSREALRAATEVTRR